MTIEQYGDDDLYEIAVKSLSEVEPDPGQKSKTFADLEQKLRDKILKAEEGIRMQLGEAAPRTISGGDAPEGYESLWGVLQEALAQAADGKGKERHAKAGEPFDRQKICEITRRVGLGYPLGQAIKKAEESLVLGGHRGIAEILGAINYLAAAVICAKEMENVGEPVAPSEEPKKSIFQASLDDMVNDAFAYGFAVTHISPSEFFEIDNAETQPFKKNFNEAIRTMQHAVHANAQAHGWWDDSREDGTVIALMHSELSECVEALRAGNPPDKHCPQHGNALVELADCVIRILDFCHSKGWNLGKAILDKHEVNKGRPVKHGGKLF